MVFFYEIVSKPLATEMLPEETCPVCHKKGRLQLTLYMRYVVAILPMYGMGRTTSVICTECNHIVKNQQASIFAKKKYPPSIDTAIKLLRATHKRTTWQLLYPWSFWFVLAGPCMVGLVYSRLQKHKADQTKELITHPRTGDVYKATWDISGGTSVAKRVKVVSISGDTVVIVTARKPIPSHANYYDEKEWDKLSGVGYDSREYKLRLSSLTKGADFFEYPNETNGNTTKYLGSVMGRGSSNYSFDVVERP